jgi:hypothetical protein
MRDIDPKLADELLGRWGELEITDRFYIIGRLSNSSAFGELIEEIAKELNRA